MSNAYEADMIFEDKNGKELAEPYCVLEDGRRVIEIDGVDHRHEPSELAGVITKLTKKVKRGQELIEICLGDDAIWFGIVKKRK